ncbi:ABC transporter substrate-binding protein [Granulosicoccus antarcticus]|uniref:Probable sugar-binding periplasmic protein n=1 Tax=Granulosicoccus antarcticus IMCC3135 TaxID=1192854 RepID=A0A2Z2NS49_9GAMM|nr:ABC transporter substrate-binding protein [Granulosicoccus antarcticus]ASJ70387.1 Multiple sugar-binding protein [Granulosicoccus antarcticus IMCC3135]
MRAFALNTAAMIVGISLSGIALADKTVISIESWRAEDQAIWDEKILPAFESEHPDIEVQFKPTTATEYNAALNARLAGGTAGDIITCRPFDNALAMYDAGDLADIKDLPGLENFSDVAKSAWSTDAGDATFCVPMASVIHGFMYNKDAFAELGIEVPKTEAEFYAALDKIKDEGSYIPMAMGTKDQWEAATMGYTNIGPTYWAGEEGRLALLKGEAKFTDEPFVEGFRQMEKWIPYLGNGYQAQSYTDSQNLFTLGRAAIYPTGSWEITGFQEFAEFELGAFAPPAKDADSKCYISDHTDIGIGMNAASKNQEAARTFLEWTTGAEFAALLTNAAPGFFSLGTHEITVENDLAKEFIAMREQCEPTIRVAHQILSRGEPALGNHLWTLTANVINGSMTPEAAAADAQANIDGWYKP